MTPIGPSDYGAFYDDALEDDEVLIDPTHCGPTERDHRFRSGAWICVCGDLVIEEEESGG